jgi:hypothetical protein
MVRALTAGLFAGGGVGAVAGTIAFPVVGTAVGLWVGASVGALFGLLNAVALMASGAQRRRASVARIVGAVVSSAAGLLVFRWHSPTEAALVAVSAVLGAALAPLVLRPSGGTAALEPPGPSAGPASAATSERSSAPPSEPASASSTTLRFAAFGTAGGAAFGALVGLVRGLVVYPWTAWFAAMEIGFVGAGLGFLFGLTLGAGATLRDGSARAAGKRVLPHPARGRPSPERRP